MLCIALQGGLTAIRLVLTKIQTVLELSSGAAAADSTSAADFSLLVAQFTSHISSGAITEEIFEISAKILKELYSNIGIFKELVFGRQNSVKTKNPKFSNP